MHHRPADADPSFRQAPAKLAVYWDFDNMLISRYDQIHGKGAYRSACIGRRPLNAETRAALAAARLDLHAVATHLSAQGGTTVVSRAYGDWSSPASATYGPDLVVYGSDLVQLFPVSYGKNGADIRLTIDVVEDLRSRPEITDVVIFAGDSDYVALARHCQRHGRRVVGVGVQGHSASSWLQACDEFVFFDRLVSDKSSARLLLVEALRQLHTRHPGQWISQSGVKATMLRLDGTFTHPEHARFSDFIDAHADLLEFGPALPTSRQIALREVDPRSWPAPSDAVDHSPAA